MNGLLDDWMDEYESMRFIITLDTGTNRRLE